MAKNEQMTVTEWEKSAPNDETLLKVYSKYYFAHGKLKLVIKNPSTKEILRSSVFTKMDSVLRPLNGSLQDDETSALLRLYHQCLERRQRWNEVGREPYLRLIAVQYF